MRNVRIVYQYYKYINMVVFLIKNCYLIVTYYEFLKINVW